MKIKYRVALITFGFIVLAAGVAGVFYFQSEKYKSLVARERERVSKEAKSYCGSLFEEIIEDDFKEYHEENSDNSNEGEVVENSTDSTEDTIVDDNKEGAEDESAPEEESAEEVIAVPLTGARVDELKVIRDDVSLDELSSCLNKLSDVEDPLDEVRLRGEIAEAKRFLDLYVLIDEKYDENGVFLDSVAEDEIIEIEKELETFSKGYKKKGINRVATVRAELEKIKDAKEKTLALFNDGANVNELASAEVRADVNREWLNAAKTAIDILPQEALKEKLSSELGRVETQVAENERRAEEERRERERIYRERLEAERRRQAQIAASWRTIEVPYISQNLAGVNNGCEAASLLMALNYKGYLAGKGLRDYATEMPKSDDPSTGFYLDIFGAEPRTEAHWIAPAPLAEFGRNSSGYQGVYDVSGSSLEALRDEMLAGNPVIIYLTFNFQNPINYSRGVPSNLHVLVLSGYNTMTGEYRLTDPWTRNGQSQFNVAGNRVATLYAQVGYRAVVVK